jgi:hypothetical protein
VKPSSQKWHDEVLVSPRPAFVPVTIKVMDDLVVPLSGSPGLLPFLGKLSRPRHSSSL